MASVTWKGCVRKVGWEIDPISRSNELQTVGDSFRSRQQLVADDLLMRLPWWFVIGRCVAASAEKQCFFVRAANRYNAHFEPDRVAGKRQSVQHLPSHLFWLCSVGMMYRLL